MILTDYFRSDMPEQWHFARQCGVRYGTIRLPEEQGFDLNDSQAWESLVSRYRSVGIEPLIIEPVPNYLHDHIKTGDDRRDASIDSLIKMFPFMAKYGITTLCFNFMAFVGWIRTRSDFPERGGALVTAFDKTQYVPDDRAITAEALWNNYEYFIKAVLPEAEKYGIRLALHPDDPPVRCLGQVERIMISADAFNRAMSFMDSPFLGITFCQASFAMMGENLTDMIFRFREKIFFIHFRNVSGTKNGFRETFHDNGDLQMNALLRLYGTLPENTPIRVDHVPTMYGEQNDKPGYETLGRLLAIGYLKGLLEGNGIPYV